MESIVLTLCLIAVFYFMMIRPEQKRKKAAEAMRNGLKKGDRITTIGGLVGKIVFVSQETIVFETSEDRVRIEVAKWAVQSVGDQMQGSVRKEKKVDASDGESNPSGR